MNVLLNLFTINYSLYGLAENSYQAKIWLKTLRMSDLLSD
jgi:hypothetical protein